MKYLWCVDCTVIAEFDSFDEAVEELEAATERVQAVGDSTVSKEDIVIISEAEYDLL